MEKIGVVSCGKSKRSTAAPARSLYTGALFRSSLERLRRMGIKRFVILSAKHGVLLPDQVVEPYDLYLKDLGDAGYRKWCKWVIRQLGNLFPQALRTYAGPAPAKLVGLAADHYLAPLRDLFRMEEPLAGKGMFERVQLPVLFNLSAPDLARALLAAGVNATKTMTLLEHLGVHRAANVVYQAQTGEHARPAPTLTPAQVAKAKRLTPRTGLFG